MGRRVPDVVAFRGREDLSDAVSDGISRIERVSPGPCLARVGRDDEADDRGRIEGDRGRIDITAGHDCFPWLRACALETVGSTVSVSRIGSRFRITESV